MNKYIIATICILTSIQLYGQSEFSLHNLNYSVPQSNTLNPAFYSYHKVVFGFPALSSLHVRSDFDPLSFDQIFTQQNHQSYQLDYDKIANQLETQNLLGLSTNIQLLYIGLNIKKSHFSFSISERANAIFSYSEDIMKTAIYGNGSPEILGKKIAFNELGFEQVAYHEIALGFARDINDRLTLGMKVKYLAGVFNVQMKDIDGYLINTEDEIQIRHQGFSIHTTGHSFVDNEEDMTSLITNTLPGKNKNTGFAFDIGAHYQLNEKISLAAAVNDLGFINWKDDTRAFVFNPVDYSFKGFEILKVIDGEDSDDFVQQEVDSLENLFSPEEIDGISYKSSLTAKANLGFDYALLPSHHIGINAQASFFDHKINHAFAAYYNLRPRRIFNATVHVAMQNGQFNTIGLGTSLDLGPLQIYGTSESLSSFIRPDKASMIDIRVGINFVFGKTNKKKKIPKVSDTIAAPIYDEKTDSIAEENPI